MLSLLTRGIIPRDVDLSPAFERGNAPFMFGKATMSKKKDYVPLSQKTLTGPPSLKVKFSLLTFVKYKKAPATDDPNMQNTNTFLTALGNPMMTTSGGAK